MKRFEKLAVVLIALWLINVVLSAFSPFLLRQMIENENTSSLIESSRLIVLSISVAIKSIEAIACGVWLYLEAKRENRSVWLWCLAGVAFQIPAVIAFIAYIILNEIRNKNPNHH